MITGEVTAVWCYVREGSFGVGKANATKAKHCIRLGSPIAINTGEQWYLADAGDRLALKYRLTDLAGYQVTVRGTVTDRNGQQVIAVTHVERATSRSLRPQRPPRKASQPSSRPSFPIDNAGHVG